MLRGRGCCLGWLSVYDTATLSGGGGTGQHNGFFLLNGTGGGDSSPTTYSTGYGCSGCPPPAGMRLLLPPPIGSWLSPGRHRVVLWLVTFSRSVNLLVGGCCDRHLFSLVLLLCIFIMLLSLANASPLLFSSLSDVLPLSSFLGWMLGHRLLG